MRVAVVAHSHPAVRVGGGEVAAYREFEELSRRNLAPVFVGMTDDRAAGATIFRGGQTVALNGPSDFLVKASEFDVFGYEFADIAAEDALVEFLVAQEVEAFHFHHFWNVGAGVIGRVMTARPDAVFALTLHEYQAICAADGQLIRTRTGSPCLRASPVDCALCRPEHGPFEHIVRRKKLTDLLNRFDLLLSPSRFLKARFVEWGMAANRIEVLENGLHVPPDAGVHELGPEARASRFAFFGQATATKGLNVLVDAAAHLAATSDKGLTIDVYGVTAAGFAVLYPDKAVPKSVTFRGRYQPDEAITLMRRFGWIIVPSVWWENSPVVIQEARAARVPTIASRLGGVLEKTEGWSMHFSPGDPVDLARVIDAVAGDAKVLEAASERITPPLDTGAFADRLLALLAAARGRRGERGAG